MSRKHQRQQVWLSYDLGFKGDYEGLYAWLDDHNAKECGENLAYFSFDYVGDVFQSLENDLSNAISWDKNSRIYVIYRSDDKWRGRFIKSRRKRAPWSGYGTPNEKEEDEADSPTIP